SVSTPSIAVPSYVLPRPERYRSSRVARPTPSSSTPVAMGSRVPAWPTFFVPRSFRTPSTTSCDVMPAGLKATTSPSGWLTSPAGDKPRPTVLDRAREVAHALLERTLRRVPRREPVSAAAPVRGDLGHVVPSPGSHA